MFYGSAFLHKTRDMRIEVILENVNIDVALCSLVAFYSNKNERTSIYYNILIYNRYNI